VQFGQYNSIRRTPCKVIFGGIRRKSRRVVICPLTDAAGLIKVRASMPLAEELEGIRVDDALIQYVCDLFAPEDDHLRVLRDESIAQGLPQAHIHPEEGRMLQFLLGLIGAHRVLEIGTLAGYSATWIARGLPDGGHLISLDRDPDRADLTRGLLAEAGLSDRVEVRVGEAPGVLSDLAAEGPFDAIFIDANKDAYPAYLDWALDNIRPGGLIMAHNAFMRGRIADPDAQSEYNVQSMQTFNHRIADDPRLDGMIIPIGDGIVAARLIH
jgi:caffeoyl-CoA O-methyltransferase